MDNVWVSLDELNVQAKVAEIVNRDELDNPIHNEPALETNIEIACDAEYGCGYRERLETGAR